MNELEAEVADLRARVAELEKALTLIFSGQRDYNTFHEAHLTVLRLQDEALAALRGGK